MADFLPFQKCSLFAPARTCYWARKYTNIQILEGKQKFLKETKNFGRKPKNLRMQFDTSGPS